MSRRCRRRTSHQHRSAICGKYFSEYPWYSLAAYAYVRMQVMNLLKINTRRPVPRPLRPNMNVSIFPDWMIFSG